MAATSAIAQGQSGKGLHIALWVFQVVLGLMFTFAGFAKATSPVAELAPRMTWAPDVPLALLRFIGVSEFLGGIGLILPAATRIRPILTPLAGLGLATIMVLAAGFHVMRGEMMAVPINLSMAGIAGFIAWGRLKKAPISGR